MTVKETLQKLESEQAKLQMEELYGKNGVQENIERYIHVTEGFEKTYGDGDILLFSSPGRTEISGNHTDHNHGKVLAGNVLQWPVRGKLRWLQSQVWSGIRT